MLEDLRTLFQQTKATTGCWCMWFIIPVKDYHAGRGAQNEHLFTELVRNSEVPMGLVAYLDGTPAGWIASGPRSRYCRALKTPTLQGSDSREDENVWLVSCFFVAREHRRKGVAGQLLKEAVSMAQKLGAKAIEGFPTQGARIASTDSQVGTEHLFASQGFEALRRPSTNRVIMRRDL
jgi:GNAT superfamily N-acetyltransferase